MEEALRAKLLATAALTTLVANRIDWGMPPQGATGEQLALHLISDIPEMKLSGPSGWSDARVQCDCWGSTHSKAMKVGRALSAAVIGLRETIQGVRLRIFVIDRDGTSDLVAGTVRHRTRIDLRVSYQA